MKKKTLAVALAFVLVIAMSVAGTFAYLTAKTEAVVNTFTVGKVDIDLTETTGETYKMIPGVDITKDPTVTVKTGSEASWVFVKIEKSADFDNFMTFAVADGWTELENGVYYRAVEAVVKDDVTFSVIKDNTVNVKKDVVFTAEQPTLTFTAYAIQQAGFDSVAAAWAEVSK